jgi:hypothetical protein
MDLSSPADNEARWGAVVGRFDGNHINGTEYLRRIGLEINNE